MVKLEMLWKPRRPSGSGFTSSSTLSLWEINSPNLILSEGGDSLAIPLLLLGEMREDPLAFLLRGGTSVVLSVFKTAFDDFLDADFRDFLLPLSSVSFKSALDFFLDRLFFFFGSSARGGDSRFSSWLTS